jgi:hypothetical protein
LSDRHIAGCRHNFVKIRCTYPRCRESRLRKSRESLGFGPNHAYEEVGMAIRFAMTQLLLAGLFAGCDSNNAPTNLPPNPTLSPNAPPDQPFDSRDKEEVEAYRAAIAPYVEKGRKTFPEAKRRYLEGLPPGHSFFAVTNLRDNSGVTEQVFVAVAGLKDDRITGRIASDIRGVKGFKNGDPYSFLESELVDWLITHPDGSEEGNVVGKFLDEWQKTRPRK